MKFIKFNLLAGRPLIAASVAVLVLVVSALGQPTYSVLHNFKTVGANGGMIQDSKGNLYGVTQGRNRQFGVVFEMRRFPTRWTYKLLYRFTGGTDGAYPQPGLVFDNAGNLYGTTSGGGANACNNAPTCGTVFKLTPTPKGQWIEQVLYNFTGNGNGSNPSYGLIPDGSGNFYGTTAFEGTLPGRGTVFRLSHRPDGTWKHRLLYSFTGGTDGSLVAGHLALDSAGNIYGTTTHGGDGVNCSASPDCGTVFRLAHGTWAYSRLHSFCSLADCSDGGYPPGGVVFDEQGNLYGLTSSGAIPFTGPGTAFELSPGPGGIWTFNVLYTFCSVEHCADGTRPQGGLIRDAAGSLYGPTLNTVFKLSPVPSASWNLQALYNFCQLPGCTDGSEPTGDLNIDATGNLYGTTPVPGYGVLFQITQ